MIARKPALVLAFANVTEALAVERYCQSAGLPGRIIPVPREITAGCGLAWKAAPEDEARLVAALDGEGLRYSGVYHISI